MLPTIAREPLEIENIDVGLPKFADKLEQNLRNAIEFIKVTRDNLQRKLPYVYSNAKKD